MKTRQFSAVHKHNTLTCAVLCKCTRCVRLGFCVFYVFFCLTMCRYWTLNSTHSLTLDWRLYLFSWLLLLDDAFVDLSRNQTNPGRLNKSLLHQPPSHGQVAGIEAKE